jgi:hypothetical protein
MKKLRWEWNERGDDGVYISEEYFNNKTVEENIITVFLMKIEQHASLTYEYKMFIRSINFEAEFSSPTKDVTMVQDLVMKRILQETHKWLQFLTEYAKFYG